MTSNCIKILISNSVQHKYVFNDSQLAEFSLLLCAISTHFQQFRFNTSITVSCVYVYYLFHCSLGYICSWSPQFLFKQKTRLCVCNELCCSLNFYFLYLDKKAILTFRNINQWMCVTYDSNSFFLNSLRHNYTYSQWWCWRTFHRSGMVLVDKGWYLKKRTYQSIV